MTGHVSAREVQSGRKYANKVGKEKYKNSNLEILRYVRHQGSKIGTSSIYIKHSRLSPNIKASLSAVVFVNRKQQFQEKRFILIAGILP